METIAKIRRRHFREGESVSSIARDLNLSRTTVRKYLKPEAAVTYHRGEQPKPMLGPYEAVLNAWLLKESYLPKRHRRTARRLFEGLQLEGYQGAYDSVQRFVKHWKQHHTRDHQTQAFVPLAFAPGETCQFDWSHEQVEINGAVQMVKVAHFRLTHSRKMFVVAYPRETQEMVLDAHNRAFAFFGGVPKRMVYDNLKAVVDAILVGKDRQFNRRFMALANHYLFEPVACTPGCGWEKGQVENQVGNLREWLFTPCPRFKDFSALNQWLENRCVELDQRKHPTQTGYRIADIFTLEQPTLNPVTAPFDGYIAHMMRVQRTCLISYDRNRYSVPAHYVGQVVCVRVYANQIEVIADEQVIAYHERCFGREQLICEVWHYLPVAEQKPGVLRHGVPFQALPQSVLQVRDQILKQPRGDRAFVEILQYTRDVGLEALEVVCELVLDYGAVTPAIVMNELRRLAEPDIPPNLDVRESFPLRVEPVANCHRYDTLLRGTYVN